MITNRVVKQDDHVFGVYDSDSTYVMIHYVNKGARKDEPIVGAHIDVEVMFDAMEKLDRRKGRS